MIIDAMQVMFAQMSDSMNNTFNNDKNVINNTMINNNTNVDNKIETIQNAASRMELLEKIDLRSKASSRVSSKANSPGTTMAKLHTKLPVEEKPPVAAPY